MEAPLSPEWGFLFRKLAKKAKTLARQVDQQQYRPFSQEREQGRTCSA
jgi:hypothetical protein